MPGATQGDPFVVHALMHGAVYTQPRSLAFLADSRFMPTPD